MSTCNSKPNISKKPKNTPNTALKIKYELYLKLFTALSAAICLWVDITCTDKNKVYTHTEIKDIKYKFVNLLKRIMYTVVQLQTNTYPKKLFSRGVDFALNPTFSKYPTTPEVN